MTEKARLGDWLDTISDQIPTVPAEKIYDLPRKAISAYMDRKIEERGFEEEFRGFVDSVNDVPKGNMVRWSTCTTGLKYMMDKGIGGGQDQQSLKKSDGHLRFPEADHLTNPPIDDPRFMDLLYETPGETIGVYERPLVHTLVHETHPVEFRAFVNDGMVQGVSAYYPQDPLGDSFTKPAEQVGIMAEELQKDLPWNNFTADFLLVPKTGHNQSAVNHWDAIHSRHWNGGMLGDDYTLAFLEGGPEHRINKGAFPCCFKRGGIEGIALEPQHDGSPKNPPKADSVKEVFQPDPQLDPSESAVSSSGVSMG